MNPSIEADGLLWAFFLLAIAFALIVRASDRRRRRRLAAQAAVRGWSYRTDDIDHQGLLRPGTSLLGLPDKPAEFLELIEASQDGRRIRLFTTRQLDSAQDHDPTVVSVLVDLGTRWPSTVVTPDLRTWASLRGSTGPLMTPPPAHLPGWPPAVRLPSRGDEAPAAYGEDPAFTRALLHDGMTRWLMSGRRQPPHLEVSGRQLLIRSRHHKLTPAGVDELLELVEGFCARVPPGLWRWSTQAA